MNKVICISAGQLNTKKHNSQLNRRNQYLNYGLLSLASQLKEYQLNPIVIHGHFDNPETTLQTAVLNGLETTIYPLLVSVPSFYAVSWARAFTARVKSKRPNIRIIVGGRWVVGERPELLKELIPDADQIVCGLAESVIYEMVAGAKPIRLVTDKEATGPSARPPLLNYTLLHNRSLYQPSVEIARGCGMGCSFCQEKNEKLQPLKNPQLLAKELQNILLRDSLVEMTPYFETSMFTPKRAWVNHLHRAFDEAELKISWRTEARVDTLDPKLIPALAQTGLSIVDLGLESASPRQLLRMEKTKNPTCYLDRASRLLWACAESGVRVKVNILLFAGENSDTISETLQWLETHRACIYGISASPLIAFGWRPYAEPYLETLASYGATPSHSPCVGVTHLNLSPDLDYEGSLEIARFISKQFMRTSQYYKLKSFSYYPRTYSFENFLADMGHEPGSQSFSTAFLDECIEEVMGLAA